jgi:hypothetical protein
MGGLHAAEARSARVGVTVTFGKIALLVSLAAPAQGADRCERAFCRCVSASALGLSAEELVHRQRERANNVVLGRVVRVDTLAPHLVGHGPERITSRALAAHLTVSRVWKGLPTDTLTVVFGSIGLRSSCDLSLETDSSYVIFASRDEEGVLRTTQCTGTAPEGDATATISALGPGKEPGS